MKRTHRLLFAALAAAVLVAGLVYLVLRLAHVHEPAETTVHGPTLRRLWATASAALGLAGAVAGSLALTRTGRFGTTAGKLGAVVAGVVAALNGGLVLAFATGGPGSGNGVVGGAGALVLGVIAIALGGAALARSRSLARRTAD